MEDEETTGLVGERERQGERPMIVAHVKAEDARSGNRGKCGARLDGNQGRRGEDDERFGMGRKRNWWWKRREADEWRGESVKKEARKRRREEDEVKLRSKTAITGCDVVRQKYRHIWAVLFVTAVMVLPTIMMTSSEIYASGYVIYTANASYALSKG